MYLGSEYASSPCIIISVLYLLKASIRAYNAQETSIKELYTRSNKYTRAARSFYDLNRWIALRLVLLASILSATVAIFVVYFNQQSASNTGFSIQMAGKHLPVKKATL
jgi:hypothetical protein